MITVSDSYKEIMARKIRNRAYASVVLGIVNQDAQKNGHVSSDCLSWSDPDSIFDNTSAQKEYATMEQNFFKADGSMLFLPENYTHENVTCAITENLLGSLRIDFGATYLIKGLTITFSATSFPTKFTVSTAEYSYTYTNSGAEVSLTDTLGETSYIIITPITMSGGQQRMRINRIVMGNGISFTNKEIQDLSITDYVSSISEELPSETMQATLFDQEELFNIDDSNSYINFLEANQEVNISFGLEMDDETIEWMQYAKLYLSDWQSKKGIMTINVVDRLSLLDDEYSLGNKIYTRTAYEEAESILADAGVGSGEYVLDEYLKDVTLTNPMPIMSHRECLQLLANACRCIIFHDTNGRINIKANFSVILSPEDLTITSNSVASWSNLNNILHSNDILYADMSKDFFATDGSMYFMPEDGSYLDTEYVSASISNSSGTFSTNPTITITFPSLISYYGLNLDFGRKVPKAMNIKTYANGTLIKTVSLSELTSLTYVEEEFSNFDTIIFEFTKAEAYSRIVLQQFSFGEFVDFALTKDLMLEQPNGYMEEKVQNISIKIFTFENDENGVPQEVEDNFVYRKKLGIVGKSIVCSNPLVATEEHASLLAEWLGNYYSNNVTYDVMYRGEPRIETADIIKMDSDILSNLQVEVKEHRLNFNGAFNGSLVLRRALRMVE